MHKSQPQKGEFKWAWLCESNSSHIPSLHYSHGGSNIYNGLNHVIMFDGTTKIISTAGSNIFPRDDDYGPS